MADSPNATDRRALTMAQLKREYEAWINGAENVPTLLAELRNAVEEADLFKAPVSEIAALAGSECSACGFRYFEHNGHIIPCPRCEAERLDGLINTPELQDFDKAVPLECAHQVERWGEAHDRSKSAENWYWLVGYLAGKALRSSIGGDKEKALHHTISAAAALRNWHMAIKRDTSGTGVGEDPDLVLLDAGEQPPISRA